jgi:transposase, IS5 family
MRAKRDCQLPLTINLGEHDHVDELREISRILDANPEATDIVHADLTHGLRKDRGRDALTAEQVLRAAVLYHIHTFRYRELAFEVQFNSAYRNFCRLRWDQRPSKSALQRDISRISPESWTEINGGLVGYAISVGVEDGKAVRTDCTVIESNIHYPTDSLLLWDCVRKLTDLLDDASDIIRVSYSNHRKVAKRRSLAISNAKRAKQRVPLYRDLLKVTHKTIGYARRAVAALRIRKHVLAPYQAEQLSHFVVLADRVAEQAERRVLRGESVPSEEKIVSIFEEHTDIICKGGRETQYGHKICISAGRSNLITDCVVLDGNPNDSKLTVEMMERHTKLFGTCADQAAFDAGFASMENLEALKAHGIADVMFHKRVGLEISDMVKDSWVYKKLRNFRAGIEGIISFLKRGFGAHRSRWKGLRAFRAFAMSTVVSANLLTLARHALA